MASAYSINSENTFNDGCVECIPCDDGSGSSVTNIVDDSTITLTSGVTLNTDGYIEFDGTVGLATGLQVACREPFTVLIEIELEDLDSDHALWGLEHATSPNCQWYIDDYASGDRLDAYFGGHTIASDGSVNAIDTRYQLALVSDGSTMALYVNGTLDVSTGGSNTVDASTIDEYIGSAPGIDGKTLRGRVYQFRRFSETKTAAEIAAWAEDTDYGLTQGEDTTAPTFTVAPAAANATTSGHDITATINEDGTLYAVVLASGDAAPTSAQVKAGNDSNDSAAPESATVAASGGSEASMTFSALEPSTAYDYYVVAEDDEATPNIQSSPTLVSATTSTPVRGVNSVTGTIAPGETITLNCASLDAAPTVQAVTLGGQSLSNVVWGDGTAIQSDIPTNIALKWGESTYQVAVTDDSGSVTLDSQTLSARSGWGYTNFTGTAPTTTDEGFYNSCENDAAIATTPESGDQWQYETSAGAIDSDVTVSDNGLITIEPAATKTGLYALYDTSAGTRSAESTFTFAEKATLTSEGLTATGETTMDAVVTTDVDTGTLYVALYESATEQVATDLAAATGASASDSVAISATGEVTFNLTGLSAGVTYYAQFTHLNSGVYSEVAVTRGVPTAGGVTPSIYMYANQQVIA
jgi:hypothetical protein